MNLGASEADLRSQAEILSSMPSSQWDMFLMSLTPAEVEVLRYDWQFWGRPAQLEPGGSWSVWLALAGRGFGKTRLGSEWIRSCACGATPDAPGLANHIAIVGETAADARDVMVEGPSGILAVHPPKFRPKYESSKRKLTWPNGCVAHTYSAEDPEQLRGPEHDLAWSDELAKWKNPEDTWDMLQFGLRVGDRPRQLVTTTPRPIPIVRDLMAGEKTGETVVTRGSTFQNSANLAPKFLRKMEDKYVGTRLGRQELNAEILDDVPGALWTRAMLDRRSPQNPLGAGMSRAEAAALPPMRRIVVGVDPSGTSGEASVKMRRKADKSDEAGDDVGIVAAGMDDAGNLYVLEDATCNFGPADWALRVKQVFQRQQADLVVAEMNFGGAMVEFTIRSVDRNLPFRMVHASRGKVVRAQPIAALYEQGRVRHVTSLPALEDQMLSMTSSGYEGRGSPDRLDAAVWALTDLAFGKSSRGGVGTVRGLG